MFQGVYHGKEKHTADLDLILERARAAGGQELLVTAGSVDEARAAESLCKQHPGLRFTVGVHPTRCLEFLPASDRDGVVQACGDCASAEWHPSPSQLEHAEKHMSELREIASRGVQSGAVAAVGECGLDYDRLHFCPAPVQRFFFEWHFKLAGDTGLPLFLHNRNTGGDFLAAVQRNAVHVSAGVAHSFTGDADELVALLASGLFIGLNGCSLKTPENCAVAAAVPLDRLMLETDCPWCDIRPSHASHTHVVSSWPVKKKEKWRADATVKGRSEPCHMVAVAEAVAGIMQCPVEEVRDAAWRNAVKVFGVSPLA
jgi:TatD DNase family protein